MDPSSTERRAPRASSALRAAAVIACCTAAGCGGERAGAELPRGTTRLVSVFDSAHVEGRVDPAAPPAREEWRFDARAEGPPRWHAGPGVEDLRVEDGRLVGTTTDPVPCLWLEREPRGAEGDPIHALEIRMSASAGANLYFSFQGGGPPDVERPRAYWSAAPEHLQVPIVADGRMRTYTFEPRSSLWMQKISALLIAPCDASGASFAIESVRMVSRNEHLASIPTGVAWQGVQGVWRETIVARAPEAIRFRLVVPERAWLDASVAVLDGAPVRFRVEVTAGGRTERVADVLVADTDRWHELAAELAPWSGQTVELALALEAERAGAIAFWGAPVVRERAAAVAPGAPGAPGSRGAPRGVVLVIADTLRADHLSFAGYARETAPAAATLAQHGAWFTDCTAQATWTQPSTLSIVTSLHPASHGVVGMGNRLADEADTLAEAFRDAGYATIGFSSVKFTGRFTGFHQGFETLHEAESLPQEKATKSAAYYVPRAIEWIGKHAQDRFFVLLHVFDPHDPYRPRSPFDTRWADPARTPEHLAEAARAKEAIEDPALREIGLPTRAELGAAGIDADRWVGHERDWYDGSILGMDQELARLMTHLREMGLLSSTLVVLTSDHGEEFLEHGRMWHGQSVYSELTRVPLVFFGAGVPRAGLRIDEPVSSIDLMPTLLEMFDLRAPRVAQGQSLVPLLERAAGRPVPEDAWTRRPIVTQKTSLDDERASPPPRKAGMLAIHDGRWKLVHNEPRAEGTPEWELYDRSKDPLDQHEVAAEHPEIVERLRLALEQWKREVAGVRLDAAGSDEVDADALRDMRAMGYAR